jgi:terminase small subunit-like protein
LFWAATISQERPVPRPSRYTAELAERVLHQLRAGRPLRLLCGDAGMPSARTVQGWVNDDRHGFAAAYLRARETGLGHPPGYSAETADRILEELRRGRTLIDVCRDHGMPLCATVRDWVRHDRHGFAAPYRAALRAGGARWARPTRYAEVIADCILDGLGEGRTLEAICADPDMPTAAAVRRWVTEDRDGLRRATGRCARPAATGWRISWSIAPMTEAASGCNAPEKTAPSNGCSTASTSAVPGCVATSSACCCRAGCATPMAATA